ncbi:MAG: hypothetical protein JRI75_03695 [Deltaproteobacteria bacterium]|jgi:hypothetical protein|nr:hypothetical protein [Deltaproteobacteria bacterium]
MTENNNNEVEALCPECGHAFKTFMDRVLHEDRDAGEKEGADCPVCGCGECRIGK